MSHDDRRDRDAADLRDRFEAAERRSGDDRPRRRRGGCLPVIGIGVLAAVLIGVFAPKPPPPPGGADLKPLETGCDKAWAERTRASAQRRGIVRGQATDGLDIIVVVNPFTWHRLSLDSQRALGLATACQIDKFEAVTVRFRYNRDGADILRMSGVELYELGKDRFISAPTTAPPSGFRDIAWGGRPTSGLKPLPGSDTVWVGQKKPPAPYLGVVASDEDYVFEHGRLIAGDVFFATPATYAAIKTALVATYGLPSSADVNDTTEIYRWGWATAKVRIQVSYNLPKTSTTLHIETTR